MVPEKKSDTINDNKYTSNGKVVNLVFYDTDKDKDTWGGGGGGVVVRGGVNGGV